MDVYHFAIGLVGTRYTTENAHYHMVSLLLRVINHHSNRADNVTNSISFHSSSCALKRLCTCLGLI